MSLVGGFSQGYHHHHHHHLHGAAASGPGPSAEAVYVAASAAAAYYPTSTRYDGTSATDGPYFSTWSYASADSPSEMSPGGDYASTSPLYGTGQTAADYASSVIMGAGAPSSLGVAVNGNGSGGPCLALGAAAKETTTYEVAPQRFVKRRVTANRKERRRTLSINTAFADLRDCIPNVPSDTKLSKIKTLRLATSYIAYLMDILAKDDPNSIPEGGFKAEVNKKIETREEKKKKEMASLLGTAVIEKKSKGRTGWPQHVWALELKQ